MKKITQKCDRKARRIVPRPGALAGRTRTCAASSRTRGLCAVSLLTFGYRGWMSGLRTTDMSAWEHVFKAFSNDLGLCHAKRSVEALSHWVLSIEAASDRVVEVCPLNAQGLCEDECMALSIVAAAQANACPAMRACTVTLLGTADVEPVVTAAEELAGELLAADQILEPSMIVPMRMVMATSTGVGIH